MDTPEKRREAMARRSRKAPEREVREQAGRGAGNERAAPQRAAEQRHPWPIRPLTPEDLAGGAMDKPSQAEGARETVEEDLRIQDERRAAPRHAGRPRRQG